MRLRLTACTIPIAFLVLVAPTYSQQPSNPSDNQLLEPVTAKADIYPAGVDAGKEIADAIKRAGSEEKRVLVVFGANWCYDCHVLDQALRVGDAAKVMKQNFILVHVDIGEGEKNSELVKAYKIPLGKGVPAVAVLDKDGRILFSSTEGEFEAARLMMRKDLVAFLNHWRSSKHSQ